ncbi:chloroplastic group IIA intron splicing facilitator CRS1, chloroplastic [Oryza brachyantha]|nr:chloroplastic group IIA intron splicing facilitator CRS1, chloroplastic [Oryza brachyantha]
MSPPPLPLFSPSPKAAPLPPPPWLHGPHVALPDPAEAPPRQQPRGPRTRPAPGKPGSGSSSARPLTAGVPGGRTRRAVLGIIRKVRSLELSDPRRPSPNGGGGGGGGGSSAATARVPFHLPMEQEEEEKGRQRAVPWAAARDEELKVVLRREKKVRVPTRAEAELEPAELERLRQLARGMDRWARAKKAGITDEVVEELRGAWARRVQELAGVRIVEPLQRNMDRAREILEIKTGGIVVWTKGDIHFVYRGANYIENSKRHHDFVHNEEVSPVTANFPASQGKYGSKAESFHENDQSIDVHKDNEPVKGTLYEREVNRLLDSLGPRFVDWWWNTPLPVDADLLPEVVPGFKTPFRQCPPGVRPTLADQELTYLRKLARPLPTHFALGRNTKLQGLAAAILKLWEKSLIAKIAVKVGIQNTNHEQMARNLKRLTGGTVILRNKDFIIIYRGKDFLPGDVAESVIERESQVHDQQAKEEEARLKVVDSLQMLAAVSPEKSSVGTFREYQDFQDNHECGTTENNNVRIQLEAKKHLLEKELKDHEWRLSTLTKKIERSNQVLAKLHSSWSPSEQDGDRELLTEEERMILRKIGLKMDEHVLLGRRGIFEGVIEEIHQHWKHKEVVKVITKQNQARQITYTSMMLEVETGGMLIAIERLTTSHAIILYRGKNYRRPSKSSPSNLLTKREALQRSIEVQRRGSLKYFAQERKKSIDELKRRLTNVVREIRKLNHYTEQPWQHDQYQH